MGERRLGLGGHLGERWWGRGSGGTEMRGGGGEETVEERRWGSKAERRQVVFQPIMKTTFPQ